MKFIEFISRDVKTPFGTYPRFFLFIVFFIVGRILIRISSNLSKRLAVSKPDVEAERDVIEGKKQVDAFAYLDPNLYKRVNRRDLVSDKEADKMARGIAHMLGVSVVSILLNPSKIFWEDEEGVINLIKTLPNKMSVSKVSDYFLRLYGRDLRVEVADKFDREQIAQLSRAISALRD